jgi:phosphate transport system permease protein
MFTSTPLVRKKLARERWVKILFGLMAASMIVPLVLIIAYLLVKAAPVLSWEFLFTMPRDNMKEGGILPALMGTFYMVLISLLVSAPIGILAAVYLNEYAGDNWFTRIINLAVVNLAGVPSIVHALFGMGAFILLTGKACILAASLTLAIMTLPVIIASTKQSLAAVPMAFREACWNVGASRWQTIRTIVLPNSFSGILTGVILQVSRAAGETAPILYTGATYWRPGMPQPVFWPPTFSNLFGWLWDQSMTLSMHLYSIATQGGQVPEAVQYGTAVVLLGLVLILNLASICLRIYFRSRKRW